MDKNKAKFEIIRHNQYVLNKERMLSGESNDFLRDLSFNTIKKKLRYCGYEAKYSDMTVNRGFSLSIAYPPKSEFGIKLCSNIFTDYSPEKHKISQCFHFYDIAYYHSINKEYIRKMFEDVWRIDMQSKGGWFLTIHRNFTFNIPHTKKLHVFGYNYDHSQIIVRVDDEYTLPKCIMDSI